MSIGYLFWFIFVGFFFLAYGLYLKVIFLCIACIILKTLTTFHTSYLLASINLLAHNYVHKLSTILTNCVVILFLRHNFIIYKLPLKS